MSINKRNTTEVKKYGQLNLDQCVLDNDGNLMQTVTEYLPTVPDVIFRMTRQTVLIFESEIW